ncbi:hypothetical protein [Curtobacterium sp. PhB136]|uniref:hypothetical protein n=1 Tax=Curtobacterium sp. PhB136 TaxID=2485181 RepID=UPI001046118D|nr:hypothetical protein [Curtobacterium sp. PhB136]
MHLRPVREGPCQVITDLLRDQFRTNRSSTWANDFNDNYAIEADWPTEAAARVHELQGQRLLELVERELPAEDDVVLGYWETNRRKGL